MWQRLQEASPELFLLLNEVTDPPQLHIGVNTDAGGVVTERKQMYKQLENIAREFSPDGVVPRITEKEK